MSASSPAPLVAVLAVGLVVGLVAGDVRAALPPSKLAAVAVRALAYDRALKGRVGPRLDVLVVHDGSATGARSAREIVDGLTTLKGVVVQGAPMQPEIVVVTDEAALGAALDARAPDAVWLCSGSLVGPLVTAARARRITTLTHEPPLVDAGIMLGVDGAGDKPALIVNLTEARAAGVDFASDMLKLARVIR